MVNQYHFVMLSLIFFPTALNAMDESRERFEKKDVSSDYKQKRNAFLGIDDGTARITSEQAKEHYFNSYKDSYERQILKNNKDIQRNCLTGTCLLAACCCCLGLSITPEITNLISPMLETSKAQVIPELCNVCAASGSFLVGLLACCTMCKNCCEKPILQNKLHTWKKIKDLQLLEMKMK